MGSMLDTLIARQWDDDIVPQLIDYIRRPAKSPHFDPDWKRHGHIEASIVQARTWAEKQGISGLTLEVVRLGERTPVLFFDVPARGAGASQKSVLFYGHLDKQPEMSGNAMKAKIHASVAVGERRVSSSEMLARTTHTA